MAQQTFGRRQSVMPDGTRGKTASGQTALGSLPDSESHSPAEKTGRSAGKSVLIVSMVAGLVLAAALGVASALNRADVPSGDGLAATEQVAAPQQECFGQPDCANQYRVALSCGGDEHRSTTVESADAEAAERKAERYNQGCRTSRAVFVGVVRTAGYGALNPYRSAEPSARYAAHGTSTGRTWRFRRR